MYYLLLFPHLSSSSNPSKPFTFPSHLIYPSLSRYFTPLYIVIILFLLNTAFPISTIFIQYIASISFLILLATPAPGSSLTCHLLATSIHLSLAIRYLASPHLPRLPLAFTFLWPLPSSCLLIRISSPSAVRLSVQYALSMIIISIPSFSLYNLITVHLPPDWLQGFNKRSAVISI